MTTLKQLRRRCEARARELPLPAPFDVWAFCEAIAARRRRPIHLRTMTGAPGVCGLWVAADTADLIFYEQATTRPHQEHIILHELSHLLCDHYSMSLSAAEYARLLLPSLDPEMVRRILARTTYSAVEEQEAELLASLIRQRAYPASGSPPGPETSPQISRIHATLNWSHDDPGSRNH
ncbi:hypothetical protein ABZ897_30420 [Nonomuraea sp. NPDC046802]|uniref:hypothetical protein n=1 Tax=Nonomuraea sp. NPDC046802 TaxID=3154919 RepID=UPI00340E795F